MVDLALKNLLHDKLRFFITVSGVAFAVLLVLVQVGMFLGFLANASLTIDHLDCDLWVTSRNAPNVDFAHTFPETRVLRVRSIPGVARADNLIVAFMNFSLPNGATEGALVYAMENFERWSFPWKVEKGALSDLRRGRFVFLDDSAVKRMGAFDTGDYREVADRRLEIIGRTQEAKSFTTNPLAFMDYDLAQSLQPDTLRGRTSYIVVKLAPAADVTRVSAEIARRLPFNEVHTRAEWSKRSRAYWIGSTGIGLNMYITVFLGVLVGIVVVAQTLYTSTMEHLKEFGTVKAIGGSNRDTDFAAASGNCRGHRLRSGAASLVCTDPRHAARIAQASDHTWISRNGVLRDGGDVRARLDGFLPQGCRDRPGAGFSRLK